MLPLKRTIANANKVTNMGVNYYFGRIAQLMLSGVLTGVATPVMATVVTDSLGQEIRLEQPAKKIVALAPHLVENAYSAGAGHRLVAVVDYSDYPPEARELPRLGSAMAVSVETVLALQPDLVLAWET